MKRIKFFVLTIAALASFSQVALALQADCTSSDKAAQAACCQSFADYDSGGICPTLTQDANRVKSCQLCAEYGANNRCSATGSYSSDYCYPR